MLPPSNPVYDSKGQGISCLDKMSEITSLYLKEYGIVLNLSGYASTCEKYYKLDQENTKEAWSLSQELNAWSQYLSDYANLIQNIFLDAETDKISILSEKSAEYAEKTVASGDRMANTTKEVIAARKKRNALKSLYDMLSSEVQFLERGYYSCKFVAEWGTKEKSRNSH